MENDYTGIKTITPNTTARITLKPDREHLAKVKGSWGKGNEKEKIFNDGKSSKEGLEGVSLVRNMQRPLNYK